MKTGSWDIAVQVGKMPQKVATAMAKLNETIMGAEYEMIAYIGSQVVNGTNHAVLAEQTVVNGRDSKNIVVLIFNEKPNVETVSLVSIERILESGEALGGLHLDVKTDLDDDVMKIWNDAFEGFVGSTVTPYALLGTQVTKGTNYIFAAALSTMAYEPEEKALIVTINPMEGTVKMGDMLTSKHEASLGYAFTW